MDTIANFLTYIRNAYAIQKTIVRVPASKMIKSILTVLKKEHYIVNFEEDETTSATSRPMITVTLRYDHKLPAVARIRRISSPGQRVYATASTIPQPKTGVGTLILSTSYGVMTGRDAKKQGIGGEVVCEVIRGA